MICYHCKEKIYGLRFPTSEDYIIPGHSELEKWGCPLCNNLIILKKIEEVTK